MNIKQRKNAIVVAAVLAGLSAAIVLMLGLMMPVAIAPVQFNTPSGIADAPGGQSTSDHKGRGVPPPAELQRVCAIDLRRPLFDSAASAATQTAAAAPVAPASSVALRLIGTLIETDHSMAVFVKADGSIVVRGLGQKIDDPAGPATVAVIEYRKVSVQIRGESVDLILPATP